MFREGSYQKISSSLSIKTIKSLGKLGQFLSVTVKYIFSFIQWRLKKVWKRIKICIKRRTRKLTTDNKLSLCSFFLLLLNFFQSCLVLTYVIVGNTEEHEKKARFVT